MSLSIIFQMARIPDGPRFVYSGVYGTFPPPFDFPPQAAHSTKMSGMSDFALPEAIPLRWYQPQTVQASFVLDYMKPHPLLDAAGASFD